MTGKIIDFYEVEKKSDLVSFSPSFPYFLMEKVSYPPSKELKSMENRKSNQITLLIF